MKTKGWIAAAAAACVVAVGGGGTAYAMQNEITVYHYGTPSTVRTYSTTVEDLLKAQGIEVHKNDLVIPDLGTTVDDGTEIQVIQRRPATVTVDGTAEEVLTTGTTVQDALDELDLDLEGAAITPDVSTELAADGTDVEVTTSKTITIKGQRGQDTFTVNAATVGEAMKKVLGDYQDADKALLNGKEIDKSSAIEDGATYQIVRTRQKERTETEEVAFTTETKKSDSLFTGETKVETKGVKGEKTTTLRDTLVDGKVTETETLSEKVTKEPVTEVVLEGTKEKPKNREETRSNGSSKNRDGESSRGADRESPKRSTSSTDQSGSGVGATQTCKASHYGQGDGTHGGPTASGERFNKHAMTAAHKSLPLGTRIRVTNNNTGQSVVVRINDRGPYVGGRCLDLSYGAFSAIGNPGSGVMTVSWQRVG
ncbi:septal ring lytic transglycosylase RlpA family protein [Brachybacterium timonense]|uniref:septal ring lytic transglycosylase RlpA family protein n=1 Tax=Brachybacterium timonense TaxID=2050896 RepID=UPI000D0B4A5F|nr:septal ring lytic transglycosylase RlpA family protein [Brachybacterium timonense]